MRGEPKPSRPTPKCRPNNVSVLWNSGPKPCRRRTGCCSRDTADQPPSVQFRERQAARDPADPTNTCSRRSAVPRGTAPGATSSGLPLSSLPGDRAFGSRLRLRWPGGRCAGGVCRRASRSEDLFVRCDVCCAPLRPGAFWVGQPGRSQVAAPALHPVATASRGVGAHERRADALHPRAKPNRRSKAHGTARSASRRRATTVATRFMDDRSRPHANSCERRRVPGSPARDSDLRIAPEDAGPVGNAG
jgi:hypothetical protein